jgi:hypothetical protein
MGAQRYELFFDLPTFVHNFIVKYLKSRFIFAFVFPFEIALKWGAKIILIFAFSKLSRIFFYSRLFFYFLKELRAVFKSECKGSTFFLICKLFFQKK